MGKWGTPGWDMPPWPPCCRLPREGEMGLYWLEWKWGRPCSTGGWGWKAEHFGEFSGQAFQHVPRSVDALRWTLSIDRPWKDFFFNHGAKKTTTSQNYQKHFSNALGALFPTSQSLRFHHPFSREGCCCSLTAGSSSLPLHAGGHRRKQRNRTETFVPATFLYTWLSPP